MSMSLMSSKSTAGGTKSSDFPATVMSNILALAAETLQMKTTSTSSSIISESLLSALDVTPFS